jgi:hypothetical protein
MADPFSVTGIVLSGLALPAQLYSSCVLAYSTVATVRDIGHAFKTLSLQLKVQQTRFLVWGQNWDIYGRGLNPGDLSTLVYETIVATLVQINTLLQDSSELCSRYGLRSMGESGQPDTSVFAREIQRQSTLVFQVQKSCSLFRKMRWTIQDQTKFESLIKELTACNDSLYEFRPLRGSTLSTVAVNAEILAQTIVDEGFQGVKRLQQEARASGPQMQNLGDMAGAISTASQREEIENLDGSPSSLSAPSQSLLVDLHQLSQLTSMPNDALSRRSWATLRSDFSSSRGRGFEVVIEWRTYNPIRLTEASKRALINRIEALVKMLRGEPKPSCFRVLDCLGYFEDDSNPRFGLVFRFPRESERPNSQAPLTLFHALSVPRNSSLVPYLEERFRLATDLAGSLYELHASGWLHKSINSHNILFFETEPVFEFGAPRRPLSLENPYFTGFASSRPDNPTEISSRRSIDRQVGVYRHPDVQGFSGGAVALYHAEYDIYSLGVVLLEIGTWLRAESLFRENISGTEFKDLLLTKYVPMLGPSVGKQYMTAVRKCIDGKFDGLHGFQREERDSEDYKLNLRRSFYWEVVKILGECRV